MIPQPYTVVRRRRETHDTVTLFLEPTDGRVNAPAFEPGQFNMLYLPGKGEAAISISGDPLGSTALVHTIRGVGALTEALCARKKGSMVGVRGPFGSSWPVRQAEGTDVIVVAGGIGLAPLRPAFLYLLEHRDRYGRITLLYGARSPREMLYVPELEKWRSRFDIELEVTVDNADSDWYGRVGVVTTLIPQAVHDPEDTVAMICGPEIMMRFTIKRLLEQELQRQNIYLSYERNMKCAVGFCGHCQFGPKFVCKDGPVFGFDDIQWLMKVREV
jgi:NAD(P)H-flavin reductase